MTTDAVRVRVLAVPGVGDGGHAHPGCACAEWALEWKDDLMAALPASARGRLDLDVEMAHPSAAGWSPEEARMAVAAPAAQGGSPTADNGQHATDLALLISPTGSALRESARELLAATIVEFGPDVVLALGTGSVVAYEALVIARRRVPLLVTLGSPLAMPGVFATLTPAPTHAQGVWPAAAEHWIDIYDRRDPFAARRPLIHHFDGPVADRPIELSGRYLSCPTLGVLLEDHFARRRPDRSLPADLRAVLVGLCGEEAAINALLQDIGFPIARLPAFVSADARWGEVMHELVSGTLRNGIDRLVERARRRYPDNAELDRLRRECNRPGSLRG